MRPAKPEDVTQTVPLLVEAIDHLALQLSGSPDRKGAEPTFARFFTATDNRYSHIFMRIASIDGTIAAIALAYPGRRENELVVPIQIAMRKRQPPFDYIHERESCDDEFYLDAIAVSTTHRGKKLADLLIDDACQIAHTQGFKRIGLLVDLDKPEVKRLYARLGFVVDSERMLAGHRYEHMQRKL